MNGQRSATARDGNGRASPWKHGNCRSRCLAELKERVQQGLYNVPSHALAEKLLLAALQEYRAGGSSDAKQGGSYSGSKSGSESPAEGLLPADAACSSIGIRSKIQRSYVIG